MSITSTVNTLNKIIIAREVYDNYVSYFYDNHPVEPYNPDFEMFVKQRHDELKHPALITEWTSNMDKDAYKKQSR